MVAKGSYTGKLPKVIVSSVVRSTQQGESHGGLYIVDLETSENKQVVDWNDPSINWEGRGKDRGLRGIDFYDNKVYVAASDEIFVYDQEFNIIKSYTNPFLVHCHEIHINYDTLFLTSTGFDSLLLFDLKNEQFITGYNVRRRFFGLKLYLSKFDPDLEKGPKKDDALHINNVFVQDGAIFFTGTQLDNLYYISRDSLFKYASIPKGTHNSRPYKGGVLANDTASDRVAYFNRKGEVLKSVPLVQYREDALLNANIKKDTARQAFGRGLCITQDGLIIVGSSPSTITVYNLEEEKMLKTVNITMDVRNAIHGLEIWPFS